MSNVSKCHIRTHSNNLEPSILLNMKKENKAGKFGMGNEESGESFPSSPQVENTIRFNASNHFSLQVDGRPVYPQFKHQNSKQILKKKLKASILKVQKISYNNHLQSAQITLAKMRSSRLYDIIAIFKLLISTFLIILPHPVPIPLSLILLTISAFCNIILIFLCAYFAKNTFKILRMFTTFLFSPIEFCLCLCFVYMQYNQMNENETEISDRLENTRISNMLLKFYSEYDLFPFLFIYDADFNELKQLLSKIYNFFSRLVSHIFSNIRPRLFILYSIIFMGIYEYSVIDNSLFRLQITPSSYILHISGSLIYQNIIRILFVLSGLIFLTFISLRPDKIQNLRLILTKSHKTSIEDNLKLISIDKKYKFIKSILENVYRNLRSLNNISLKRGENILRLVRHFNLVHLRLSQTMLHSRVNLQLNLDFFKKYENCGIKTSHERT